ncbi:DUF2793 domain-containing protein [Sphingomonas sanguinis]|jgi:hypothetical protein|uniref:DUF2793 domain-containing protein n=1 Tax=Sphingomonas sanguinis TaxID=33051 RepID=A0A7Y7QY32_9SPHN|nr:DUF2793 domain-containing protein [Sphingomonas sanguinis]MBZ6383123.1 DUF2793 domain-containing protein [Sphingomonas sanguinis]NNG49985.1 DUF2793 domain-containing protein [Sphingomonas sanguinis]NNG53678.1 DUF2793 domain-containing protein [Sphingomonas sanguinis]NVP32419.1 DUF2793 domain-containing protein [Sphingomonas sanguinis]
MVTETPRWTLPLLEAGQAQKEITHNEALSLLDLIVQPCVEAVGLNVPPGVPQLGQAWIIGPQPTGAWAGHAAALTGWTDGGWRFLAPREGMGVWSRAEQCRSEWDGNAWRTGRVLAREVIVEGKKVIGSQRSAIAVPSGGQVIDIEARNALASVIAALGAHGLIASG